MELKRVVVLVVFVAVMAGVAEADSWSVSTHYLRLNQAQPSGNTDNLGIAVSYDKEMYPNLTLGVEAVGSWDNPAELYGGGINMKYSMGGTGQLVPYGGAYIDYVHARGLPSRAQGGTGGSEEGFIYGPLVGVKMPLSQNSDVFCQYQYGWIDGGTLRRAFDEANWFVIGLTMKF
ncbi:MAG: hypothetical protein ACYS4W_06195 [Planctomycetota bacterium]|jgi:hypothetical protein